MRIEFAAVRRALDRRGLRHIPVFQTGIGKDAILACLGRHLQNTRAIILAGACGALAHVDDVPPIERIIDEHGNQWPCTQHFPGTPVTLIAMDRIVSTPEDKASLAASTGAAIVDMESHAFAAECQRRGLTWHVVRGVSDTPDETLPHEVLAWVTPEGNTRAGRAVLDMARRPSLVPHIATVLRRSSRVLPKVGAAVADTIDHWVKSGVIAPS